MMGKALDSCGNSNYIHFPSHLFCDICSARSSLKILEMSDSHGAGVVGFGTLQGTRVLMDIET